MEALILVLVLAGLIAITFGIAFYVRLWSTLGMHRQAMHALHQELAQQRLGRLQAQSLGHVPPQADPRTDPGR